MTCSCWEAASGALGQRLRGHTTSVVHVAFDKNSRLLASASQDGVVNLWDVTTAKQVHSLKGHHSQVTALGFPSRRRATGLGRYRQEGDPVERPFGL